MRTAVRAGVAAAALRPQLAQGADGFSAFLPGAVLQSAQKVQEGDVRFLLRGLGRFVWRFLEAWLFCFSVEGVTTGWSVASVLFPEAGAAVRLRGASWGHRQR